MEKERETRAQRIDLQLARAGWTAGGRTLIEEFLLTGPTGLKEPIPQYRDQNEFADYALPDRLRRPIGIVEAKRSSRSPIEGERQASDYADRIKAVHGVDPFIFLANGNEIWFWHRRLYPPHKVSGFFTLDDLERLAFLGRYHEPLLGVEVCPTIGDRAYEFQAVKAVAERIEKSFRKFLLVMATGTGKTRTAIALIELLLRQKWIQRVLFLADRRELVKQALDAFKEFLPAVPRARIETGEVDPAARILVATYPGMMSVFQKLSPGYFDLILADESHRSIYNRYGGIFDYFHSLQVGLTATPTDFLDHNTFKLFSCEDGLPTFHYGYDEAVRDGYLVPYRPVHVAKTHFQVEGLQPGQLPPALLQQLQQQGIDAADLTFEGTDLERRVTNTGTNDAIIREFMDASIKDAVGARPAKSIIFAVSHKHALEIYQSFNRLYPDLQRQGLAKIIDSHMERAEKTLDDFKHKDFPRVAISVDMLDTGIDVPAIRNLVFAKPVFSQVKFWQMIGRGTRLWTDPDSGQRKEDFLIIDHWDNFAYFQVNPEGRGEGAITEPLPTRLFRLRLEKLQILAGRAETAHADATRAQLQTMLGGLPLENINVAPHAEKIGRLSADAGAWTPLDDAKVTHLSATIAPLLRFAAADGWTVLQFENLTEQLALAQLKADAKETERLREPISENLKLLPTELPEIRAVQTQLAFALSPGFWEHLDYARVADLQTAFAPLMRFRARRDGGEMIRLTLPDSIVQRHWIVFGPAGEGAFVQAYREQIEAFIRDLAEENPALRKLQTGAELSPDELDSIARLLNGPDLFVTEERLRQAYDQPDASLADFLRHILGQARLPSREQRISQAFEDWVARHPTLNATQLMFVRTLRQAVLSRAHIASLDQLHRLELPPEAAHLRWAVGLQERPLRGLCDRATAPAIVTPAWVQGLWNDAPAKWVERFSTRRVAGQATLELMCVIAEATGEEKLAVLDGFLNDCRCDMAFGLLPGSFRLRGLECCGSNAALEAAVKKLFLRFYDPEFDAGEGFSAPGAGAREGRLDRPAFVKAFARHNHLSVCPYCDRPLVPALAKVDHIYPKSEYPFLAITPENLVPACTDCNSIQVKGARVPLAVGAENEVAEWFHPYHRPADGEFRVGFLTPRADDQPRQVCLRSEDDVTQRQLDNLDQLLGVTGLWADRLKHRMKGRISALRTQRRREGRALAADDLRRQCLEWAEEASAGRSHVEFAILEEAWCRYAADGDSQFLNELAAVNTEPT